MFRKSILKSKWWCETVCAGLDPHTNVLSLYQTDLSATVPAWKADATGRNSNSMHDFLEKNFWTRNCEASYLCISRGPIAEDMNSIPLASNNYWGFQTVRKQGEALKL